MFSLFKGYFVEVWCSLWPEHGPMAIPSHKGGPVGHVVSSGMPCAELRVGSSVSKK